MQTCHVIDRQPIMSRQAILVHDWWTDTRSQKRWNNPAHQSRRRNGDHPKDGGGGATELPTCGVQTRLIGFDLFSCVDVFAAVERNGGACLDKLKAGLLPNQPDCLVAEATATEKLNNIK